MQKQFQPIKRSRQLAVLSREHHEGLLFVWKIKQGIAFGIPPKRITGYCQWFWENSLKDHLKKEEMAFSPLLPDTDVLLNTMIDDHNVINEKMEQVIDDPSYHSLQRLTQIIYYHIRFEERSLFSHIEQVASEPQLEQAAKLLSAEPVTENIWRDEFWIKKPESCFFKTSVN